MTVKIRPLLAHALLVLAAFVTLSANAAEPTPLVVTVSANGVDVAGLTPGGGIVVLTASLASDDGLLQRTTGSTRFVDDDGDGVIRYEAAQPIPLRSIWIVVDLDSGRHAIARREGYPLIVRELPERLWRYEAEGIAGLLGSEIVSAEALLVRPQVGAWRLRAAEGGDGDDDKLENGALGLAIAAATPVGSDDAAPTHLRPGDFFAVIDTGRMEVFVAELEP